MSWTQVNHFHLAAGSVWDKGTHNQVFTYQAVRLTRAPLHSLGWMEMRTMLAKIHYKYDLELVDKTLDWHAQSEMHTLWQKPVMKVVVRPRSG